MIAIIYDRRMAIVIVSMKITAFLQSSNVQ